VRSGGIADRDKQFCRQKDVYFSQIGVKPTFFIMLLFALICLAIYAMVTFRKAIAPVDAQDGSQSTEGLSKKGRSSMRRADSQWIRPMLATVLAWSGITLTLTPVNPTMAVWVGGAVVAVGTAAILKSVHDPYRIDDAQFDRELRELLEQNS
jgi:hypothetical protein